MSPGTAGQASSRFSGFLCEKSGLKSSVSRQTAFAASARRLERMVAMSLLDDVMNDLKQAMKDKDTVALNTLRSIKSAVEYKKAEAGKDPEEGEILQVIQKEAKKRKDSIAQFRQGNREDLAEKEEAELKIIEKYLPAEMSDAELEEIVKKVIADVGAGSKKEIGKVMSQLMPLVRGRADGKRVNQAVGKLLD